MSYKFEVPVSGNQTVKLVHPYFDGEGRYGNMFFMYHESPPLVHGLILSTDKGDMVRIVDTWTEEDFFENIEVSVALCINNTATADINTAARELFRMYSTTDHD
jgi:hypothetical protein